MYIVSVWSSACLLSKFPFTLVYFLTLFAVYVWRHTRHPVYLQVIIFDWIRSKLLVAQGFDPQHDVNDRFCSWCSYVIRPYRLFLLHCCKCSTTIEPTQTACVGRLRRVFGRIWKTTPFCPVHQSPVNSQICLWPRGQGERMDKTTSEERQMMYFINAWWQCRKTVSKKYEFMKNTRDIKKKQFFRWKFAFEKRRERD